MLQRYGRAGKGPRANSLGCHAPAFTPLQGFWRAGSAPRGAERCLSVLHTLPPAGGSGPGARSSRTHLGLHPRFLLPILRVTDHSDIHSHALEVCGIKCLSPPSFDSAWVSVWMRGTMRSAHFQLMLQIKNARGNTGT